MTELIVFQRQMETPALYEEYTREEVASNLDRLIPADTETDVQQQQGHNQVNKEPNHKRETKGQKASTSKKHQAVHVGSRTVGRPKKINEAKQVTASVKEQSTAVSLLSTEASNLFTEDSDDHMLVSGLLNEMHITHMHFLIMCFFSIEKSVASIYIGPYSMNTENDLCRS